MRRTTIWRTVHPSSKDKGMFLSKFRRRKSVVDLIAAYTERSRRNVEHFAAMAALDDTTLADGKNAGEYLRGLDATHPRREPTINVVVNPPSGTVDPHAMAARLKQELKRHTSSPGERQYTAVMFPTTVEGCLLAEQFEHQLKQRGLT